MPALINVGQQLDDLNFCMADKVLGQISKAVGLWWLGTSESLELALECTNMSILVLEDTTYSSGNKSMTVAEDAPLRTYLTGLTLAWKGLCIAKLQQDVAKGQLESLKNKIIDECPEKKERYEGSYAVPGFTSLTIEDEMKCVSIFTQAAECFYQLSQMEVCHDPTCFKNSFPFYKQLIIDNFN